MVPLIALDLCAVFGAPDIEERCESKEIVTVKYPVAFNYRIYFHFMRVVL